MSETVSVRMDVDRGELEEERDFLLRSLDDLDEERDAGDIDDATYRTLHDDYTARAAAVVRALQTDRPERVVVTAVSSWRRRLLVIASVVTFAVVTAVSLALALGARLPGQTATGNAQGVSVEDRRARLEEAVAADPGDVEAHLALAGFLVQLGEVADALREYDAVVELDPANAEALAQGGWLLFVTAQQATTAEQQRALLDGARERLDAAVAADPASPDARVFRGLLLFRGFGDAVAAIPDLQQYLVLAPDAPLAEQVREVLAEATAEVEAGVGSGAGASTTTP